MDDLEFDLNWADDDEDCPNCAGTGLVDTDDDDGGEECPACNGEGVIEW